MKSPQKEKPLRHIVQEYHWEPNQGMWAKNRCKMYLNNEEYRLYRLICKRHLSVVCLWLTPYNK